MTLTIAEIDEIALNRRHSRTLTNSSVGGARLASNRLLMQPNAAAPSSTSGITQDKTSARSLIMYSDARSGRTNRFIKIIYNPSLATQNIPSSTVLIADTLIISDGLSGTSVSSQTIGTPALPRYSTGDGVWLLIECYTTTGATPVNCTITYTDQDGNTGQITTFAFPTTFSAGQAFPVPLASGDTGVRAVASLQLSASTGTAGNFGVTLIKPLAIVTADQKTTMFDALNALQIIGNNACITSYHMGTTCIGGELDFRIWDFE